MKTFLGFAGGPCGPCPTGSAYEFNSLAKTQPPSTVPPLQTAAATNAIARGDPEEKNRRARGA